MRVDSLSEHFFDSLSFTEKFISGDVQFLLGFSVDGETLDDLIFAVFAGNGVREDEAGGNSVASIRGDSHGSPFTVGTEDPVSNVVDSRATSGGSTGELSGLDDGSTSLLDGRDEVLFNPVVINEGSGVLALDGGEVDIGVHSGRVVTPDGELLDFFDVGTSLFGQLSEGSVVIQSGHGSEVFFGDVLSIVRSDQAVGVGGVTDDDDLDVSVGVVVEGSTGINEDLTVILQEVTSFHTRSSGLSTDKQSVVGVLETFRELVAADNGVQKGESAILEFHGDTLEGTSGSGDIEQLEDDGLVLAQHVTVGNSEDGGITDVTSSTSDSDSDGVFMAGGEVVEGDGSGERLGETDEVLEHCDQIDTFIKKEILLITKLRAAYL